MLIEHIDLDCINCNGYKKNCGPGYEPNSTPGEESPYCFRYIALMEKLKNMTVEKKKQITDNLGELLKRNPESNKGQHYRDAESSDIRAISEA